jgi:ankyrin repeat protein
MTNEHSIDPSSSSSLVQSGATSLLAAVVADSLQLVRRLLEAGTAVDTDDGAAALVQAIFEGFMDIAEELLSAGADVDAADSKGATR